MTRAESRKRTPAVFLVGFLCLVLTLGTVILLSFLCFPSSLSTDGIPQALCDTITTVASTSLAALAILQGIALVLAIAGVTLGILVVLLRPLTRARLIAWLRRQPAVPIGVVVAIVYGAFARISLDHVTGGNLSWAFLAATPPVLGFLTVILSPDPPKSSWRFALVGPWLTVSICMIIAGALAWEAYACIMLALPIFWAMASLGGILARILWAFAKAWKGPALGALALAVILPYMIAPVERAFEPTEMVRRVHSQIVINAPREVIWENITNLPDIQPQEQRAAIFHVLGLPRPIRARMVCEQVGCARRGQWEHGLAFDGTITRIEPGSSYWVTLAVDTDDVVPSGAPLDQIGGPVFDMVDDGYELEPLGDGSFVLHLYSTYRLTTRVNVYSGLWIDFLLRDIQVFILNVEKLRSERLAP